jgi:hypothetical protein
MCRTASSGISKQTVLGEVRVNALLKHVGRPAYT